MALYRVIVGEHSHWDETLRRTEIFRAYKEGDATRCDVVESDRDLVKVFPNKFERYRPMAHDDVPVASEIEPAVAHRRL